MAGGGMRTGQAIGATNRLGEYAVSRPVTHSEIVATIYKNLGLDPAATFINVVLPAPLAPSTAVTRPGDASRLTSRSARTAP